MNEYISNTYLMFYIITYSWFDNNIDILLEFWNG